MSEAVLLEYLQEIDRLIEDSHLAEAVRHCRHILSQFPRHLDTYRLMGKALLEQGELEGATDVFQRVLSSDPEDFIAHAGMAIIYKQENRLREAAWHMERAFEVEPYNGAIREALQDLIGRRDGLPPERLALTRGALARLHVRGELYSQAISDLRQLLIDEPDRIDLQVLLAEALWRDGQRIDAAEDCTAILERLPDCVKANAILAEVWLVTERVDEAQNYLRRVFELALPTASTLDQDTPIGLAFRTKGSPPLPQKIMVARVAGELSVTSAGEAGTWVNDLDLGDELVLEDVEPDWLGAIQDEVEPAEIESAALAADIEYKGNEETPEAAVNVGEGTSWFSRSSDQLPGIGELPEETDWEAWLEHERDQRVPVDPDSRVNSWDVEEVGMGTMDERGMNEEEFPESDEPQQSDPQGSDSADDSLDWLEDLQEAAEPADSAQAGELGSLEAGDLPDWLREGVGMDDVAPGELDWLDDADEGQPAGDEETVVQGDQLPDWLRDEMGLEEGAIGPKAADDLSWLDQIASGEGAPLEEPPTLSWPDSDFSEEASADDRWEAPSLEPALANAEDDAAKESLEASDAGEDRDWAPESMGAEEPYDDVPEDLDEAMAWLEQLASQQGAPAEELPSLKQESRRDEESIPEETPDEIGEAMDWLDELARAENVSGFQPLPRGDVEEADEFDDIEDATWLEDFGDEEAGIDAVAEETPGAELEAGIGRAESDGDVYEEKLDAAALDDQEEEPTDAVPEDLDEAMAWLEQLAAQQGTSVDELPSLRQGSIEEPYDAQLTGESVTQEPNMDEAMAWLEQLAAEGEPGDGLSSWEGLEETSDFEALEGLDDIPDDPELALAWLEGLAEVPGHGSDDVDEQPVVEEENTPPVPHDVVAARAEAEAILLHESRSAEEEATDSGMLEDIPDDPDEAMAWLEKLAARQGAPRDELPSLADEDAWDEEDMLDEDVSEYEDSAVATPAWLDEDLPVVEEDDIGQRDAVAATEDVKFMQESEQEDLPASEAMEEPDLQESDEVVGDLDEVLAPMAGLGLSDEELEEDLPDWLALEDDDEISEFDWEEPAFDATGWLAAEESALTTEDLESQAIVEEVSESEEQATVSGILDEEPALQVPESDESAVKAPVAYDVDAYDDELVVPGETEEVLEPLLSDSEGADAGLGVVAGDGSDALGEAQQALEAGQMDAAVERYQAYLERGEDISTLITDLERATQEHENQPALTQLLGDAYNMNGQLQKALDAYRQALAML